MSAEQSDRGSASDAIGIAERLAGELVVVLRSRDAERTRGAIEALLAGGLRCIEIADPDPSVYRVITKLRQDFSETDGFMVGAGTVLHKESARKAAECGAQFLVSPGFSGELAVEARELGLPLIPGVLTAGEVMAALDWKLPFLKLFPAGAHGPSYLRALRGPFPHVRFMPTGGVRLANLAEYFQAGASAAGIGESLVSGDLLDARDWRELQRRAADYAVRMREIRAECGFDSDRDREKPNG